MINLTRYLPTVIFLSMILFGSYVFAHFWASEDMRDLRKERIDVMDVIQGRTALAVEGIYKERFPFRDVAVGLMNTLSFGLFGEARGGILVGANGWLFTDEEFTWNRTSPATLNDHLTFVRTTVTQLRAANIEVVALLVPEKADIYAENLGKVAQPQSRASYYQSVLSALQEIDGLAVPDLRSVFLAAKEGEPVFLKADTHWTVSGAGRAAGAAADALMDTKSFARSQFELKPQEVIDHEGDLHNFLKFGPFSSLFDQPREKITRLNAEAVSLGLDDLFSDDPLSEIVLVGSSYSANPIWSFEAHLRHELEADVINYASEGSGPFKPMETFLAEKWGDLPDLKVVIWEMPLRYFDEAAF